MGIILIIPIVLILKTPMPLLPADFATLSRSVGKEVAILDHEGKTHAGILSAAGPRSLTLSRPATFRVRTIETAIMPEASSQLFWRGHNDWEKENRRPPEPPTCDKCLVGMPLFVGSLRESAFIRLHRLSHRSDCRCRRPRVMLLVTARGRGPPRSHTAARLT